jgi:EpsG-like putative glucosyltransferase
LFPYWILFSIFALGSVQYRRRLPVDQESNPLFLLAGLFVALMVGLRFHVGGDWGSYERLFEDVRYLDVSRLITGSDPGYVFLNRVAIWLGVEIWFVNLVCGAIFAWGLVKFARRQPSPWLAMLIAVPYLIIVVAMGYTRQAVAIGFVLAGLAALERGGLVRFAILVLLAVTFHKSAIVILPIVALAASRNRLLTVGLLVVLAAILYSVFVSPAIDYMATNYAQYEAQGAAIRVAMNIPPALIFLRYQREFGLPPWQQKLWRNFSIAAFATLAVLLMVSASAAVDRLALYLIPLQIFVLSRLPHIFRGNGAWNGQIMLALIAYSALIQLVWLNYADNAYYWLPYRVWPFFSDSMEVYQ